MTRVIAGECKGLKLHNPPGKSIRPSTDRTKEWIFSVLYDVRDLIVLDIFCGAGNLGIEALSRGAKNCTFVDSSDRAISLTNKNLQLCGYENRSRVLKTDVIRFLHNSAEQFDLILADPPYQFPKFGDLIQAAVARLTGPGRFFLETSDPVEENLPDHITEIRREVMGGTVVTVYGESV